MNLILLCISTMLLLTKTHVLFVRFLYLHKVAKPYLLRAPPQWSGWRGNRVFLRRLSRGSTWQRGEIFTRRGRQRYHKQHTKNINTPGADGLAFSCFNCLREHRRVKGGRAVGVIDKYEKEGKGIRSGRKHTLRGYHSFVYAHVSASVSCGLHRVSQYPHTPPKAKRIPLGLQPSPAHKNWLRDGIKKKLISAKWIQERVHASYREKGCKGSEERIGSGHRFQWLV